MKRLFTIILLLVLLLPAAAALAEDEPFHISKHYSLFIDGTSGQLNAGKGGRTFDFDSYTVDLYLSEDGRTGYLIETTCDSGFFLNSGMIKVKIGTVRGTTLLVYENGDHIEVEPEEDGQAIWIHFSRGWFRLQLVPSFDMYTDWK